MKDQVTQIERLQAEIAAARATIAQLEARADVDPLTDILNRRGFERELEALIAGERVRHAGAELSVGASAGIAALDAHLTPAQAIDAADRAMYARKKERR